VILPTVRGKACQILRISEKTKPATTATYVQRVNLAIDHIVGHLHEPLRLRDLSRVAMLSPFHFHRVFQVLVGSTPAEFVKRLRLEKALMLMARPHSPSLTAIALGCGFSSSSDFSRCFKRRLKDVGLLMRLSPHSFRVMEIWDGGPCPASATTDKSEALTRPRSKMLNPRSGRAHESVTTLTRSGSLRLLQAIRQRFGVG
jgi:AraC-like DNA-binding protein